MGSVALPAAHAEAPLTADGSSGWAVRWQPKAWRTVDQIGHGSELVSSRIAASGNHEDADFADDLGPHDSRRLLDGGSDGHRWVKVGTRGGVATALTAKCPRMPQTDGYVHRSKGVPAGPGCKLMRATLGGTGLAQRAPESSGGWSEGVSAEAGDWLAISRWRRGDRPELRIWHAKRLVGTIRGPLGSASLSLARRQSGPLASGIADLALGPTGRLAIVWQSPTAALSCRSVKLFHTYNTPIPNRGGFNRDLVTINLKSGRQRWINHAPCDDPPPDAWSKHHPVERQPVGWTPEGSLVVEDPELRCPVVVAPSSLKVVALSLDDANSAGQPSGPWPGLIASVRRVSARGLEALQFYGGDRDDSSQTWSIPYAIEGWYHAFAPPATLPRLDCSQTLVPGAPRHPGKALLTWSPTKPH
jgi:hypothetical protein